MKNILKTAYKETPDRFRHTVSCAVDEARQSAPTRRRLPKSAAIAIAIALIAVILPTAVFGASQIMRLHAEKAGSFGIELSATVDPDAAYPDYVKMNVTVPEGFAEVPNTNGMKYYRLSAEKPYTDGFSLEVFRPFGGVFDIAYYAEDYEETVIQGHPAYKIIPAENYGGFDRIYIYYEEFNVVLLVYHKDVTDAQLEAFIAGVTFSEGSIGDIPLDPPAKQDAACLSVCEQEEDFIPKPLDIELQYGSVDANGMFDDSVALTSQVAGVRVLDRIDELNIADFNDLYPLDETIGADGAILPHTRRIIRYGDGLNSADEVVSSETVGQKLVLIDIRYTNPENIEKKIYIPWQLTAMKKGADGKLTHSETIDKDKHIYADAFCSGEIFYMEPHGAGVTDFYCPVIGAGETTTVTVGFLADEDKLDELYLMCCPSADSVISPAYPTENPYTYYVMKVLQDDGQPQL